MTEEPAALGATRASLPGLHLTSSLSTEPGANPKGKTGTLLSTFVNVQLPGVCGAAAAALCPGQAEYAGFASSALRPQVQCDLLTLSAAILFKKSFYCGEEIVKKSFHLQNGPWLALLQIN